MKKVLLSLVAAAAMAIPASAMALDTNQEYAVSIFNGASETDVGTMNFGLVSSEGNACIYYYEWVSEDELISLDCLVAEAKALGHRGCLDNADESFDTVITRATLPGWPGDVDSDVNDDCQGFDRFRLDREILFLVLGESEDDELRGVMLTDGPAGDIQSVEAIGS